MAKILSIIAPQDFQDQEYGDCKAVLEKKGHEVITASSQEQATGKSGATVQVDVLLKDINPEDYDAIALIGGKGCYQYFENSLLHEIAQKFVRTGKPTAAICAAPMILANAGLLQGKSSTCWEDEGQNLAAKGAVYTGSSTTVDGNIITANGPSAAKKFGKLIAKALK
jgi:protease I